MDNKFQESKIKLSAEQRGVELMGLGNKNIPTIARNYLSYIKSKFGYSSNAFITACIHYAHEVEGLKFEYNSFKMSEEEKKWFRENM